MLLLSTPDILVVLGLRMLVVWLLSAFGVKLFSLSAYGTSVQASHFIAPTLALAALPTAVVARIAVAAFDEVHGQLYIRTALAKGLTSVRVVLHHALNNAWIRVAEAGQLIISSLVTGLVVVEYILYFPGIGRTLGLILEKGGQPPASSGIALLLLVVAFLIDAGFGAVRLALDPRLKEETQASRPEEAAGDRPGLLVQWPGQILHSLGQWLRSLPDRSTEWPAALIEIAWVWRPSRLLRELRENLPLLFGLGTVGLLALVALFGGRFLDLTKVHQIPRYIVAGGEIFFPPFQPGTPSYPLGSDLAGRDLVTRLVVGARYTFFFTLAVTPVRFLVALPWGLAAGLWGGVWRSAGRLLGLSFSALPVLLIPAALLPLVPALGGDPGGAASFWLISVILAVAGIPRLVEQIRQHTEAVSVQPFVEGARAVGAGAGRIFWRHIFPHLVPQLWVTVAADMTWTLLLLAQFGLFGIFLSGSVTVMTGFEIMQDSSTVPVPRIPDWSSMLSRPYDVIYRAPWSLWLPALCFLVATVAFNLVSEGLRRRAQMLQSVRGREEVDQPHRRLLIEWMAAAAVLVLVAGAAVGYGLANPALAVGQKVESPLEKARLQLQMVLDVATGPAPDQQRSQATAALRKAVDEYLKAIRVADLPISTILTDSRGGIRLLEGTDYLLLSAYIPGIRGIQPSHLFLVEKQSGVLVDEIRTIEQVQSFTLLKEVLHTELDKIDLDLLIVAGPVPTQEGRWALSAWAGSPSRRSVYLNYQPLPFEWSHRGGRDSGLTLVDRQSQGAWLMAPAARGLIAVEQNGDFIYCQTGTGPCMTYPWTGQIWATSPRP